MTKWLLLLLWVYSIGCIANAGGISVGLWIGRNGNELPPPVGKDISLCQSLGMGRMRIYKPHQATLDALNGSNIELTTVIANNHLQALADPAAAREWVQKNIRYWQDVKFRNIVVGNEVVPDDAEAQFVLPAMRNLHDAIVSFNLQGLVKVSTAINATLLGNSVPPSAGSFNDSVSSYIKPIINFLVNIEAPLLVNLYPYSSYVANPEGIDLPYALFTSPGFVVKDGNLSYQNLFDALLDAFYSALEKVGAPSLQIVVSVSRWPHKGGIAATRENAVTFTRNLINHVKGGGTPKRPGQAIETYLMVTHDKNLRGIAPRLENYVRPFFQP